MDLDLMVFRELILWLWQSHEKPWIYSDSEAYLIANNYLKLSGVFPNREQLEIHLPSEDKVRANFGPFRLYLNPVYEHHIMVPLIQLKCDFGCNLPEVRCRVSFHLLHEGAPRSLGFRFETPEGKAKEKEGKHHYYHAQIIQPDPLFYGRVEWLPERQPAFPLDVTDPVKLILCMLTSLYGLEYLAAIRAQANIWQLEKYIDNLFCFNWEPIERYWRVDIGDPGSGSEYWCQKTREPLEFENYIRLKYPGCRIVGITTTSYNTNKPARENIFPS